MKKVILVTLGALLMTATASAAKISCYARFGSDGAKISLKQNADGDLESSYKNYIFEARTLPDQFAILVTNTTTNETMSSSSNKLSKKNNYAAFRYTSDQETIDVICSAL